MHNLVNFLYSLLKIDIPIESSFSSSVQNNLLIQNIAQEILQQAIFICGSIIKLRIRNIRRKSTKAN